MRTAPPPWCIAAALLLAGCSRNAIEAVNTSIEGDTALKNGDTESAISKYDQATKLDPDNHKIWDKLARANMKKEDWKKCADAAQKAAESAERVTKKKQYADYYFRQGHCLRMLAEKGGTGAGSSSWNDAKAPLQQCVAIDSNYSDAYEDLGDALYHTDDEQGAIENYTKAIAAKPDELKNYPSLADLYIRLNYIDQAQQVLTEGLGFAKEGDKHLFAVHGLLGQVYELKDQKPQAVKEYEAAKAACGKCDEHKEAFFLLGYAYYSTGDNSRAIQNLQMFFRVGCKGALAQRYADQCAISQEVAHKLNAALQ